MSWMCFWSNNLFLKTSCILCWRHWLLFVCNWTVVFMILWVIQRLLWNILHKYVISFFISWCYWLLRHLYLFIYLGLIVKWSHWDLKFIAGSWFHWFKWSTRVFIRIFSRITAIFFLKTFVIFFKFWSTGTVWLLMFFLLLLLVRIFFIILLTIYIAFTINNYFLLIYFFCFIFLWLLSLIINLLIIQTYTALGILVILINLGNSIVKLCDFCISVRRNWLLRYANIMILYFLLLLW